MNKICCACKDTKPVEEFGKHLKNPDGLQSKCKLCKRDYDNLYHKNRTLEKKQSKYDKQVGRLNIARDYLVSYLKDKSCSVCRESRIPTLDFHHLRDKEFNISEGVTGGLSLERIKKEIEKCDILCSNCHRMETAKDFNWYSNI
jgi:hypothetical protein